MTIGAIEPEQRRIAERLILASLRRFHREQPLAVDVRMDALVSRVRAAAARRRPSRHRGSTPLALEDPELRRVVDDLVADGRLARIGRRIRLADASPGGLGPEMDARVSTLLAGLRAAGAAPPRVEGIAARIGIPPAVLDQLRSGGMLRQVAPGIDYPTDVWSALRVRIDDMPGTLNVARLRDELRTSRRHAEAILAAMGSGRTRPSPATDRRRSHPPRRA